MSPIQLTNHIRAKILISTQMIPNVKKEEILVVGSPNTAIPGAQAYAQSLSYMYQQVLKKRLNTGRTFIVSNNDERDKYFKKFILDSEAIKDKIIIFVDDSIVRGNTIKSICHLFKINGAKEIHIRVLSPPVKNPCYYGIHIPTREELLINRKNQDEIVKDVVKKLLRGYDESKIGIVTPYVGQFNMFRNYYFRKKTPTGFFERNRWEI